MITLHAFGPAFGLPDPSPFVTKVELLLKFAALPYVCQPTDPFRLRQAPKGKLPYITDDSAVIADSTFIRWHLERKYQLDFDQDLTSTQRATAWAIEKLLEDYLYWALVHERWMIDRNFHRGPAHFFQGLPAPLRPAITYLARRNVRNKLRAQGMGLHSAEEIAELARKTLTAVAIVLGDNEYLTGTCRSGTDATAIAFLAGIACPLFESEARAALASHANLCAYLRRHMTTYFPAFDPAAVPS